jgi:hypothetical protein
MLIVSAGEFGYPVLFLILVEAGNGLFHDMKENVLEALTDKHVRMQV